MTATGAQPAGASAAAVAAARAAAARAAAARADTPASAGAEARYAPPAAAQAGARHADAHTPPPLFAGLVTRAIAFAIDAALVNGAALLVAGVAVLSASLLHLPQEVETVAIALGAAAWGLWTVGYFAVFWSTTGQTPGDRAMRIRVRDLHGRDPIPLRRALLRFAGLVLGAIPLFAGYLPVLLDDRRRAFHDRLARTVVMHGGNGA